MFCLSYVAKPWIMDFHRDLPAEKIKYNGFCMIIKASRHKMQSCCAGKALESTVSCSHWHCDPTSCLSWWYAVWCRIPVYYPYGNLICRKQKSANGILNGWFLSLEKDGPEQVPEQLVRRWSLWCDPKRSYISTVYLWVIFMCKADLATVAQWAVLNCVSGVCSDLEIQQVVEQFSYMSKNYFLVFLYSWIFFLIVYP
jgi:hypothetical protein